MGDDEANNVVNTLSLLLVTTIDTRSSDERGVNTGLTGLEGEVKLVCHLLVMRLVDDDFDTIDDASDVNDDEGDVGAVDGDEGG